MAFIECDLERLIMCASKHELDERGLYLPSLKKNQVRIGNYGICDIVALERPLFYPEEFRDPYADCFNNESITISIVELKQNEVGYDALHQAIRYAKGMQSYLLRRSIYADFNIVLIGKTVNTKSDFVYVSDVFERVRIYTYSYEFDGIHFTIQDGFRLTNEGF